MDEVKSWRAIATLSKGKAKQSARQSDGSSSSQRMLLPMAARVLILAIVLNFLAFAPWAVRAQSPLEPTQIVVGAPAQSSLGGPLTVQAMLADSQGHSISKAVIYFTTQATFLGDSSDVLLAQAVTNANGQAVAQFVDDFSGTITLRAEFRGDTQYAPSNATIQTGAAGEGQVYAEHVGVDIPGFNTPPVSAPMASVQSPQSDIARFVQSLWPAMNGWPVAAVLIIVWSLYFFAVTFVFRVAALGSEAGESTSTDARRSP